MKNPATPAATRSGQSESYAEISRILRQLRSEGFPARMGGQLYLLQRRAAGDGLTGRSYNGLPGAIKGC